MTEAKISPQIMDILPPDKVFLNPKKPLSEMRAWETYYGFEKFTYPELGFLSHYQGRPYPNKGMTYTEATEANNMVKRAVIGLAMCLKPTWHPIRNCEVQLKRFLDYLYVPHYLHWRFYADSTRELFSASYMMMRKLSSQEKAYWWARIPATLLEYENSYRFRFQDICSIMDKEVLKKNPRRELKRVQKIYLAREKGSGDNTVTDKFKMVFRLLRVLLLVPRFKKAFQFAVANCDFEKFKLDEADQYWANRFNDYLYGGKSREERQLKQAFKIYA